VIGNVFHPSQYETWDGVTFGDMPDLCHRAPFVYTELINYARWLLEEIGFDGFRYEYGEGLWRLDGSLDPQNCVRCVAAPVSSRIAVGDAGTANAQSTIGSTKQTRGRTIRSRRIDFPLRWRLRDLCDGYGFSLRTLAERGVLMWGRPEAAVTFVENRDVGATTQSSRKLLAYACILTHEVYPWRLFGRITSIGTWRSRIIRAHRRAV